MMSEVKKLTRLLFTLFITFMIKQFEFFHKF